MAIDAIHNYYESLVQERIAETDEYKNDKMDEDFLEDVACVALNQLPPKYVRYSVDLIFYMSTQERDEIYVNVDEAIRKAIETVSNNKNVPVDKG